MNLFGEREKYKTGPNTMEPLPDNIRILKRNLMVASWVSILSSNGVIEIAQGAQIVSGLAIKEGAIPWILLAVVAYLAISYFTLYSVEYIKPGDFERLELPGKPFEGPEADGFDGSDAPRKNILLYYAKLSRFKTEWLNKHIPIGLSLIAVFCLVSEITTNYLRLYIM